jgi:ABC-type uncharacterized transport system involved in gliding motility auxiliary subunit
MKRYLAIPGSLLLITAFIRSAVNVEWDRTGIGLAIAGAAILAITVAWNWQEVVEWVRDPRGVFAVTTGISVAVFVAAIVMLNIAVWYRPWSVDLTASGRNQVTDDTRAILARLDEPVVLKEFGDVPKVDQLLRSFARESRSLSIEMADPEKARQESLQYGVTGMGQVVVLAGDKFRRVAEPNEQALVTAILQVTNEQQRVVCFVTGHGERGLEDKGATGLDSLRETLEASNYKTQQISLLEGGVPSSCEALIVAGPEGDLLPDEQARLTAYTDKFGHLALLLDPDPAASFAWLLKPRGIEPRAGRILDASGTGQSMGLGAAAPFALRYRDHPITRGFARPTFYEGARPLSVIENPEYGGFPISIAESSEKSFSTTRTDQIIGFDKATDQVGPLTLAAATTLRASRIPGEETRIVVFGDSDFISNAARGYQANREIFLRSLAWLLGEQEATIVAVDSRENRRILLTGRTQAIMYIVNLGVLPLIPLLAGIVVYIRSRR